MGKATPETCNILYYNVLWCNFASIITAGQKIAAARVFPLDFSSVCVYNVVAKHQYGGNTMADDFGSDFMTIVDEDGKEYELEVLSSIEYNGETYLAVTPADEDRDDADMEVSILKSVEEDGEPILCAIEDDLELETVYGLIMDQLYEEEDQV